MNYIEINKLVKDLADLARFHELETVDSKAAELLELADSIPDVTIDEEETGVWIETIRQANLIKTTR